MPEANAKQPSQALFIQNLAVLSAALELGAAVIETVMGGEETSNSLNGTMLSTKDIQEFMAARMARRFGG